MVRDVQINKQQDQPEELQPAISLGSVLALFAAVAIGALAAAVVLPAFAPGLAESLIGAEAKAYWYLSRSSAFVAFVLLWLSVVFGLLITNKLARAWPGGPMAFDLHQYTSLLGIAFALFHALILLGDHYIGYSLTQILLPFAGEDYRPLWVGLGQIAFYLSVIVSLTFYLRRQIGQRMWRLIHYLSFVLFVLAMAHGIFSGTDSGTTLANVMYWVAGGSVLFLTVYRVLSKRVS